MKKSIMLMVVIAGLLVGVNVMAMMDAPNAVIFNKSKTYKITVTQNNQSYILSSKTASFMPIVSIYSGHPTPDMFTLTSLAGNYKITFKHQGLEHYIEYARTNALGALLTTPKRVSLTEFYKKDYQKTNSTTNPIAIVIDIGISGLSIQMMDQVSATRLYPYVQHMRIQAVASQQ